MAAEGVEKVIILGSGPAGLTAAVYTSRAQLKPLMIEGEEPGGQLMTTTDVENYPGFDHGVTGPELMAVMRRQAERFGTRFVSYNATKVDLKSRPIKVWVGKTEYQCKTLIITTGASAKLLGIESEKKFFSKGVSACATCDGAFFKNVEVGIVGGGDTAMEEALFLTRFATKVHVFHRRESFRASKIMAERVMKHAKIQVHWNQEIDEVLGTDSVTGVRLKSTKDGKKSEMPLGGLFIAIGHKPNTDLFKGQLEFNPNGYLLTKPGTAGTNIEGVYAAGDVQDPTYRQAVTAAGTGCMAAIEAERWLEHHGE